MDRQTTRRVRNRPARVFIVDGHPIVRHGIAQLINQQKDLTVCGEADCHQAALMQIAQAKPDGVIVDMTQRRTRGLKLVKRLRVHCPELPVLAFSLQDEFFDAEQGLRAGASGYLAKRASTEKVIAALRAVLQGGDFFAEELNPNASSNGKLTALPRKPLTRRERDVLRLLGCGKDTREIAAELHLAASTVDSHREHIKQKLEIHGTVALIRYATRWVEAENRFRSP